METGNGETMLTAAEASAAGAASGAGAGVSTGLTSSTGAAVAAASVVDIIANEQRDVLAGPGGRSQIKYKGEREKREKIQTLERY